MISDVDIHYMRSALALAQRGIGRTAPNPSVGCVIVKDGHVIARARTADLGRPHAEFLALEQAGAKAKGATLYVTLEPCTHHGRTPPCVEAIIQAKVKKVVIGALDANLQVHGQAKEILENAGIEVVQGVLEHECVEMNAGFFSCIQKNRPYVTLKTACTLDGKIALSSGESQWITGDLARKHAHLLRARHDAILVGVGTVLQDNPMLSTRLGGLDHNPVRVVLDTHLQTPLDSILLKTAYAIRLWIFHSDEGENVSSLIAGGAALHQCDPHDLKTVLAVLATRGITRVLVEGGAKVHASFLKQGLFDELVVYRAPTVLGGDAKNASGDLNIESLAARYDFERVHMQTLGDDVLEQYKPKGA
tara:strand:- start:38432 stop:39517 length:1086 start_codon:yes stop_codon:yes gene_type:complete